MTQIELVKGLAYLGEVYNKEFSKKSVNIYYDFLKDYDYNTFVEAIKEIVKTRKFVPTVADLIEECDKHINTIDLGIIETMKNKGYFKNPNEYDKIMKWIDEGIIPSWFKEDMKLYMNEDNLISAKEEPIMIEENIENLLEEFTEKIR